MTALDLDRRCPITLGEVLAAAPATVRVDRKYLVPLATGQAFVDRLPSTFRVLAIDERRWTSYASTYFDTDDLASCRAHVQRRRRRWKFRSRLYVEDGLCRLEVKLQDGSGVTRKYFRDIPPEARGTVGSDDEAFLVGHLAELGLGEVGRLGSTVEVTYHRATLADPGAGKRVTIDHGVRCFRAGHLVELDADHVIVETKGGVVPGEADALLRDLGVRPRAFSKYAASVSLTEPGIPDNDVRSLVGRQLHVRTA